MPGAVNRHLLKAEGYAAGVHVRPSEVDPEAIQIDLFEQPGIQLTPELEKEIAKHYSRQEFRRAAYTGLGELSYPARAAESYTEDLLRTLDVETVRRRGFRIAIDYCSSSASLILPLVLGQLGVESVASHAYVVGNAAAPVAVEDAASDMKRLVTAVGADIGVVMNQTAERLYLVDDLGREVPLDQELLLFVSLLARDGARGAVAVPVTATSLVDRLLAGTAIEVRRTQASLAALTLAATENGTVFAGAASGGFVFPAFLPAYDAMASLCNLLQLLAPVDRRLSELVDELPRPALVHRKVPCPWALKGTVMRVLTERLKGRETDLLDGIKVFSDTGWSQVIPDPDEPVVHVYAEGESEEQAAELEQEMRDLIAEIVAGEPLAALDA
jgi:mannose-1-phosphate guanylyltransferase/phosphomannomutase